MKFCWQCGTVFDEAAQDDPNGCPECGSDDVSPCCVRCGGVLADGDPYDGWCRSCAEEKLTYKVGLEFLLHGGYLADFVFTRLYGVPEPVPSDSCEEFKINELAITLYQRKVIDDVLTDTRETMDKLVQYVLDDDEGFAYSFGGWLAETAREQADKEVAGR